MFCPRCGAAVDKEKVLIRYYLERGFYYSVILQLMKKYHAIEMSMRTLQNRLREYGLRRRDTNTIYYMLHSYKEATTSMS